MPTITQRGGAWRAQVRKRGQPSINRTFDTEAQARSWATKTEARLSLGTTPAQITRAPGGQSMADLFDRYAREVSPEKRGARWEVIRLDALSRAPEFAALAADFDGAALAEWRDRRLKLVSAATVNRDLNLISAVCSRAIKEWRAVMREHPVRGMMRPAQPHHRTRRVSDDERAAVIKELGWRGDAAPADLLAWTAWAFAFALETAMRQGEILGMRWGDVRARSVHLAQTKNGHARDVPLSTAARALLDILTVGKGGERVCPIEAGTCGAYFREAARGACVGDLHFHDARHEAITRMASRLSIMELARVSGHRDTRMLLGYYHPDADDLAGKLG